MADTESSDSETKDESSVPSQISYVRPADRTPEKDFHLRNEEEKKIVCYRRAMTGKVRDKLNRLEDEVDERDQTIESERQLRQAAEDRLQGYLRDMYNNTQVNQELRDRLPRASKSDPFVSKSDPFKREDATLTECSSIEEDIEAQSESQSMSKPKMKPADVKTLESQILPHERDNGATSPKSTSPKTARRSLDFTDSNKSSNVKETKAESTGAQSAAEQGIPRFPYSGLTTPHTAMFTPAFGASPYLPYSGGLLHNPVLHSFPQSSMYRPMSAPLLHSNFMNGPGSGAAHELSVNHSLSTPILQSSITATQSQTVPTTEPVLGATGGQSSASAVPQSYAPSVTGSRLNTSLLPDPLILPMSSRMPMMGASYGADHGGPMAGLLAEIDAQRTDTRKLREQLLDKERELEALKLTVKANNLEKRLDASDAERAAGLVEEVYTAQRKRDEATNNRMKLANHERDDIVARLQEVESRLDAPNSSRSYMAADNSDEDLQLEEETLESEDLHYLLSQLESGSIPDRESAVSMVRRLEMMRQRQREVTSEEMQIVMEQRDVALAKCRKLESELLRYQKQSEADGGMDKTMKAKLSALQQERDLAVAKSKQLDDEIQTIRIYYSLHKSLSPETSFMQQYQPTNHTADEQRSMRQHVEANAQHVEANAQHVEMTHEQLEHLQKENENLTSRLQAATIDKQQLQRALDTVTQDKERLQRLARVLQRKLNAFNENPEEEHH